MTRHEPSDQARVRLGGRDIYLGKFGTPEAESEYRRVLAEWFATGSRHRRSCVRRGERTSPSPN